MSKREDHQPNPPSGTWKVPDTMGTVSDFAKEHKCLSLRPLDCTNNCSAGLCDCSGEWRDGCGNREALSTLRAERDALQHQVRGLAAERDWLAGRIDSLKEGLDAAATALDGVEDATETYNYVVDRLEEGGFDA